MESHHESESVFSTLTMEEDQEEFLSFFEFTKPVEIETDFMVVESPEEVDPAFFDVVIEEEVEEALPF